MITKEQFTQALLAELAIVRHLGSKVTRDVLDYRPTEKQRSMLELMQYLSHMISISVSVNSTGDVSLYKTLGEKAPQINLENFDSVMLNQEKEVKEKLDALTEEDLNHEINLWGHNATAGFHVLSILKFVTAYKMQLFLYLKASGKTDLNTSNLWRGVDPAPEQ